MPCLRVQLLHRLSLFQQSLAVVSNKYGDAWQYPVQCDPGLALKALHGQLPNLLTAPCPVPRDCTMPHLWVGRDSRLALFFITDVQY